MEQKKSLKSLIGKWKGERSVGFSSDRQRFQFEMTIFKYDRSSGLFLAKTERLFERGIVAGVYLDDHVFLFDEYGSTYGDHIIKSKNPLYNNKNIVVANYSGHVCTHDNIMLSGTYKSKVIKESKVYPFEGEWTLKKQ